MELVQGNLVQLELTEDMVILLQRIADKQGRLKEDVASEAVVLWLEQFRHYGPAFIRKPEAAA